MFASALGIVKANVDVVRDGGFVVVFGDKVLVEEAEGLFGGCGGEPDDEGVEVVEDLSPLVVDAAVAFVDDDEVEGADGNGGVVGDGHGFFLFSDSVARLFVFHHGGAVGAAAHFVALLALY